MSNKVAHHFTVDYVNVDYLVNIDFTYPELYAIAEYKPEKEVEVKERKQKQPRYQRRLEEVATTTSYAEHLESIGYVPPKKFNLKG